MKKFSKIFLSLLLLVAVVLSCASCDIVDKFFRKENTTETDNTDRYHSGTSCNCFQRTSDGYTGGLVDRLDFHSVYGVYWLETYDEVLEAIELLESHGSVIVRSLGFDCDEEWLDSKFCFVFRKDKAEPLAEGKSFFDRRIDGGEFGWYGFYDYISISDLLYNNSVYSLDVMHFMDVHQILGTSSTNYDIVDYIDSVENISFYTWDPNDPFFDWYLDYFLVFNNERFARLKFEKTKLPLEYHNALLSTFVTIGV